MALDLGTLVGYLELDGSQFDKTIDKMPEKIRGGGALMGVAASAVAAAIGLALAGGITNAIELDTATHKITAQLGLTESESARIGGVAGKLYADAYGESVEEVNNAVQNVVSSIDGMRDATATSLEEMTAKALNFASAFEIETARSTQVVGQLIKTGLVKDATEGFDLLTAAMQKVPAGVREDIMDAADEYGPFFAAIGMSGDQAFNLLAASAEKGMYGIDKTGDALKEFTIRATDMSTASAVGYDALGMSQEDMTRRLLAGGETAATAFSEILGGLSSIKDPAAQSQAALALFGTPLEDLGVNEIPVFLDSLRSTQDVLGETAGAADKMGAALNGDVKTGWTEVSRQWDTIIGQLGTMLLPILQTVTTVLLENPALLQGLAVVLGIVALAFVALTIATWAMNTALLASPITWIILAIVALIAIIVLLVMNWDTVVAWISEIWNGFIDWLVQTLTDIGMFWIDAWARVQAAASDAWDNIVNAIMGFLAWILDLFLNWTLLGLIIQYWDEIVGAVSGAWEGLVAWIAGALALFGQLWSDHWGRVASFVGGIWGGIVGAATGAFNGLVGFLSGIPGTILGFFSGIGSWLYNAGKDLINGLLNGIKSLAGTIGGFFLGLLPSWIVAPFKAALGIRSPSTVFAGFGRNIVEGIVVGLDDEQGDLDRRMSGLVRVPTATASTMAYSDAQNASAARTAANRPGVTNQAILDMRGAQVGWNPDEVKERMDKQANIAATLSGLDEEVPVA